MNEEEEPSWLSGKNDHLHRKAVLSEEASESEPLLFGSGPIPLEGEVKTPTPMVADDDEEAQSGSNNKYGSLGNTKEASSVASSSTRDNSNKKKK
ncbi:expressed unknown protein [Seminavis robusta]|uniref:Uncharacterized protein n=1 Tax=Seminavis robusta TaxID=568900 RepID=A0A9N8ECP3_9STRA|nr:expressed unknown protein [Seminavis robusta]|eukprot:Sro980_g227480.1 n/a (95) ;mRNA; f:39626-39910